jgi:double-stranded uracil-DNA glycosylase
MHAQGFRPVATPGARVLVLGTLPGTMSLAMSQYYAQPRNAFWPIMGSLFGAFPVLAYRERLRLLKLNRLALWDVCRSAYREGALDASIEARSIVPNDFATFFRSHRRIELICFNGQTAGKLFRRLVLPGLPAQAQRIAQVTLPSTSPAHAAMRLEQKLEQWEIVRRECGA